jgi:hypothetical protein
MKKIAIQYAMFYTIVSLLSVLIASVVIRRSEIDMLRPFPIFIGTLAVSGLLLLSLRIYQAQWGNGVGNVVVSYLSLIPIPFIVRYMFVGLVFRLVGFIYIALGVVMIVYLLMLFYIRLKNQHTESQLNALLEKRKKKKSE